jgi:hypothetical protein
MAKRFTDTAKWSKSWFCDLPIKMKIVWIYLVDNCDHAGIWSVNMRLMEFQIGSKITDQELNESFGKKIIWLNNKKLWIRPFFEFQYGSKSNDWAAKRSALKSLAKYDLIASDGTLKEDLPNTSIRLTEGLADPSSICIGISKGKGNIKKEPCLKFEHFYSRYPVRTKGPKAEHNFRDQIKTPQDEADLDNALTNYLTYLSQPDNAWRKPKQSFAAFLGTKASGYFWRDWIGTDAGQTKTQTSAAYDKYFASGATT